MSSVPAPLAGLEDDAETSRLREPERCVPVVKVHRPRKPRRHRRLINAARAQKL
jgi:hypothetical protein